MLHVIDDEEEEEEAALDLVRRSHRHPEMVLAPSSQPAKDPPIVQAIDEQARADQAQPMAAAGHARRRVFFTSHRASNL